jgi:hypothetical protein
MNDVAHEPGATHFVTLKIDTSSAWSVLPALQLLQDMAKVHGFDERGDLEIDIRAGFVSSHQEVDIEGLKKRFAAYGFDHWGCEVEYHAVGTRGCEEVNNKQA